MATQKKTETDETEPSEQPSNPAIKELTDEVVQIKPQVKHEPLAEKYVSELLSSTKTRWTHFISQRKVQIITALALISWIIILGLVTLFLTDF